MIKKIHQYIRHKARHNLLLKIRIRYIQKLQDQANILDIENQKLMKLMDKAFTNPYYLKLYSEHGISRKDIQNKNDLALLPILTKNMVRDNSNNIWTGNKWFFSKGYTNGTTTVPLVLNRSLNTVIHEHAYVWWYRILNGLNFDDKKIWIRGNLKGNKTHYIDKATRTLYISSFMLHSKHIATVFEIIKNFNAKALFAYPSSATILSKWLFENDNKLIIPLTFTSSELLTVHQREIISRSLNTKVFDWYGNGQRTIALYNQDSYYYEPPLYSINEYKQESIITSSLINLEFPMINYQVNDLIACDNIYYNHVKSKKITAISGKKEDCILLPNGTKTYRFDHFFKKANNILFAQVFQKVLNQLDIHLVVDKNYTREDEEAILINCQNFVGSEMTLNFKLIQEDELVFTKSGKLKFLFSEVH